MREMFFNRLMAKIYPDRYDAYDDKPFPVGEASMLTVLFMIILLFISSLLIGGFFLTDRSGSNPAGNTSREAKH